MTKYDSVNDTKYDHNYVLIAVISRSGRLLLKADRLLSQRPPDRYE